MEEFDDQDFSYLADIMKKILSRLKEINVAFNYYIHYSPDKKNLHFHIEIIPRVAKWAGYEFSTGTIINSTTPEDAAKFYRGEE
jgi:UDPglucose--hexose-1-phosphate uridylyltransferase